MGVNGIEIHASRGKLKFMNEKRWAAHGLTQMIHLTLFWNSPLYFLIGKWTVSYAAIMFWIQSMGNERRTTSRWNYMCCYWHKPENTNLIIAFYPHDLEAVHNWIPVSRTVLCSSEAGCNSTGNKDAANSKNIVTELMNLYFIYSWKVCVLKMITDYLNLRNNRLISRH